MQFFLSKRRTNSDIPHIIVSSERRGDTMNVTAISMPSVTHAIKAKRFLSSQGYSCEIKRSANVSENGCTHMIIVNADAKIVIALLNKNHIAYGKLVRNGMP